MNENWMAMLASLLLLQGVALAQDPPLEMPNGIGTIDEIRGEVIVVGDLPYLLRDDVLVTDKSGGWLPKTALQPNRQVMVFTEGTHQPGRPPLARRIVVTGD